MLKGIDVSKHNGTVDWDAVKKAGYGDFIIIRCGIGSDYSNQDDTKFLENVKACEANGIPYGIYLYSYALNTNDAKSEAAHAIRLAKKCGANFKYGVWFDMEDADGYKKNHGMPSNATLVDICYTFCELVEKAGYYTGVYASLSWLNNQLAGSKLDRFDKWVAQWNNNDKSSYGKAHSIWQYTSSLVIGGKRFDANKLMKDFATGASTGGSSSTTPNVKLSNEEMATKVIAGEYGVQPERQKRIEAEGYNYEAIRAIVNQRMGVTSTAYYPKYTGSSVSIVDALKAVGVDNSYNNRKSIAAKNGISNYSGTASQNTTMLNLLKQGKLKK